MKYMPGVSGNPNGRKKGSVNKRTHLAKLLEPHAEELINKLLELAKNGDMDALKLCIDRLLPKLKDEAIYFSLPGGDLRRAEMLLDVGVHIIEAVSSGELTPEQGQKITAILESQRKSIKTSELVARIIEIERSLKIRK